MPAWIATVVELITTKYLGAAIGGKRYLKYAQFFIGIALLLIAIGAFSGKLAIAALGLFMIVGAANAQKPGQ